MAANDIDGDLLMGTTTPNTATQRTLPIKGVAEKLPVAGAMPVLAGSPPMARWAAVKWLAKHYPGITHPMLMAMEGVLFHAGTDDGCYASMSTLADECCVSRDTIRRGIQLCQQAGLLRSKMARDNRRTLWPVLPDECINWLTERRYLKADLVAHSHHPSSTQPLASSTQPLHNPNPTQIEQGQEPTQAAPADLSNHDSGMGGAATRQGATRQLLNDDAWGVAIHEFTDQRKLLDHYNPDLVTDWHVAARKMRYRTPKALRKHFTSYCQKRGVSLVDTDGRTEKEIADIVIAAGRSDSAETAGEALERMVMARRSA